MATIRTAIQVYDGMSGPLKSMRNVLQMTVASFEALQNASSSAVDTSSIQAARQELSKVEVAMNDFEQQIRETNEEGKKMPGSFNGVGNIISKLKTAAGGLAAAFGVQKILALSDGMTSTTARLDLMNDGLQTTVELQDKIFQSAQRSRASYMDTAATVSKLGILAKDAFSSNDEMIAFTELMNKNFVVGGASATEQAAAMYQLTQAMAAGKLQGDEYRSIIENAPLLAQSIEDYMTNVQGATGTMKEWAADGMLTADVIKAAMFSAADETEKRFKKIPMTFAQVRTILGNTLLQTFEPVIQAIGRGAQFIYDNWSTLEPIFWGLAAAVGFYAIATAISAAATWLSVAANIALIETMLANPILWIALIIGVLIAQLYKWVQSVGGLKVAWMIAMNSIMTAWDWVKIGFFTGVYWIINLWDKLKLGMMGAGIGIVNFMGDMKVDVLNILQDMVNGAINIINGFIATLNKIPGISINAINSVSFGTSAALRNQVEKQARQAGFEAYKSKIGSSIAGRDSALIQMKNDAITATAKRQIEIHAAKYEALANKNSATGFDYEKFATDIADTADNTGSMKDSMDASTEELKYLRDLAEKEVINRFTTAEIKVEMKNDMNVNSELDLDGVVTHLEEKIYETMLVAAEGVHD